MKTLDFVRGFDFSKTESQTFLVHSIRLVFLLIVFVITLAFQVLETRVEAPQAFQPIYFWILLSLTLQFGYLIFFKTLYRAAWTTAFLFFFEVIYISGLIYLIGIQQSVLIFLYLVNLILAAVLFQRRGALLLALWTSVLFSLLVSLDGQLSGPTLFLAVGVNNLAFFTVAYIAGYLSEQLNVMGAQLRESVEDVKLLKNLNELILRNISLGVVTVDEKGFILQTNPSLQTHLGRPAATVVGLPLQEVIPGLIFNDHVPGKSFDFVLKKAGEHRILSLLFNPLLDESGRERGKILVVADETHLRALEKRLRQSEKMAAIGGLAAGIAHEIRNPLAGISGSIQLLQGADVDVDQGKKLMAIIMREIDRLNNLIGEFLDYAKPEAPREDQVDLARLLEDLLQLTANQYPQLSVQVNSDLADDVKLLGNRDKLKQALLNIVVNAYQAMEKTDQRSLTVQLRKVGEQAVLSIRDSGSGMKPETKERMFEPFHTTKPKGTGLGLAITHSIFESHGVTVQVESEVGKGTEFVLRFPRLLS